MNEQASKQVQVPSPLRAFMVMKMEYMYVMG